MISVSTLTFEDSKDRKWIVELKSPEDHYFSDEERAEVWEIWKRIYDAVNRAIKGEPESEQQISGPGIVLDPTVPRE